MMDAPKEINGHIRLGATLLSTNWLPCSPLGTGKYGGESSVKDFTAFGYFTAMARAKMQPREWATMWKDFTL